MGMPLEGYRALNLADENEFLCGKILGNLGMDVSKVERPGLGIYVAAGGDDLKSYSLYEIEKGHEEEGAKEVNKRLVPFFNIEGWKFTWEPLMTPEEALPLIGL